MTGWWRDPVESGPAAGFGVYLHVPFCAHRCGYCDFATWATDAPGPGGGTVAEVVDRYVPALRADLGRQVARGLAAHAPPGEVPAGAPWPTVTSGFTTALWPIQVSCPIWAVRAARRSKKSASIVASSQ